MTISRLSRSCGSKLMVARGSRLLPAFLALLVATGLWLGTSAPLLAGASTLSTVRINAGGDAVAPFAADQYYSGGTTLHSTNVVSTAGVSNPAPEAVYQQYRYASNLTYTVPGFPSGSNAAVRLHFAETWWTGSGQRVFSVRLNGQWVLTNFDIWQVAGGSNKAVVEDFN
ncbi:MAG TPA: malectin domain-containing carbohydrate-binding protein, partial [Candidatus Dormibacteraeota bacterium]|nr:malectin domain-containing carbohydrate-binding protein [Candidatus Dormibacteraeota bacterium]